MLRVLQNAGVLILSGFLLVAGCTAMAFPQTDQHPCCPMPPPATISCHAAGCLDQPVAIQAIPRGAENASLGPATCASAPVPAPLERRAPAVSPGVTHDRFLTLHQL